MIKRVYLALFLLISSVQLMAQLAPGEWMYHLSMTNTTKVVEAGQRIYFLCDGGIFYFDKTDNSIGTFNKLDNLSGSDYYGISYNKNTKSLIVTYKSSAIDIIREDESVHPILDIKRKNISGDKLIYNVTNNGNLCYLSCGFGIVALDVEKLEIKDSYIIGDAGNYLPVYDVDFIDDQIFAGTKEGIKYAPLSSTNLLDYSNWSVVENIFIDKYNYNILETGLNRLWAIHQSEEWKGDRTFSRHAADIWYPTMEENKVIKDFKVLYNKLVYCVENPTSESNNASVEIYNDQYEKIISINTYPFIAKGIDMAPVSAIIDNDLNVWIADKNYGAIRYSNGTFTQLSPDGPLSNSVFSLTYADGKLYSAAGGISASYDNLWKSFQINTFKDGKWETIDKNRSNIDSKYSDVIQVLPFPGEPDHFYASTYGHGIVEIKDGEIIENYDASNSGLQSAVPGNDNYVRVGGMDFDSQGNLWVSNSEVASNLHVLRTTGDWEKFTLTDIGEGFVVGKVLVDANDNVWMTVPKNVTASSSSGLYVLSNDGTNKLHLNVNSYFSNGEEEVVTSMNKVNALVEDNDGAIWLGTSDGIAIYDDPENVFAEKPYYASTPGVDKNDGIYHPLLRNTNITALAVDGANRKWCGTATEGLYLISADGTAEIEHFTTDNSNLLSDAITSLAYDGENGMLYVGTQAGLASYRTDSKNAYNVFTKVYAYPNPVREGYTGDIFITGLTADTNVKITTVSGRLVYETTSLGGQAVWPGTDLAGKRVHTGVYLAFCASADGTASTVTKILFIR